MKQYNVVDLDGTIVGTVIGNNDTERSDDFDRKVLTGGFKRPDGKVLKGSDCDTLLIDC